jgi:tetratricopeptide (TPR) repeat protein
MFNIHKIITLFAISMIGIVVWGQTGDTIAQANNTKEDFRKKMRTGNQLYDNDKATEAETEYRKALHAKRDDSNASFNLGDALYRQKKYDEAGKQFEIAASAMDSKEDKARAFHNLGNSFLQQQKLKESIEAYKQALRNNPNDMDTKTNLSYAMKMLQQQQNQDKQNDKDKQDQDKDKQDKDKKDQDKQDQDQKDQDKQDQKDQNQQQNQDQKDQQDKNQQNQQQQISPEDAQRMLDALAQEEKNLQEKLQKKERAGYRSKIEKNW